MKIFLAVVLPLLIGAGIFLYTPDQSRAALEAKYHVAASDGTVANSAAVCRGGPI